MSNSPFWNGCFWGIGKEKVGYTSSSLRIFMVFTGSAVLEFWQTLVFAAESLRQKKKMKWFMHARGADCRASDRWGDEDPRRGSNVECCSSTSSKWTALKSAESCILKIFSKNLKFRIFKITSNDGFGVQGLTCLVDVFWSGKKLRENILVLFRVQGKKNFFF